MRQLAFSANFQSLNAHTSHEPNHKNIVHCLKHTHAADVCMQLLTRSHPFDPFIVLVG